MLAVLAQIRKAVAALAGGLLAWSTVVNFHHLTKGDWISLAVVVLAAFGVYAVPNQPKVP